MATWRAASLPCLAIKVTDNHKTHFTMRINLLYDFIASCRGKYQNQLLIKANKNQTSTLQTNAQSKTGIDGSQSIAMSSDCGLVDDKTSEHRKFEHCPSEALLGTAGCQFTHQRHHQQIKAISKWKFCIRRSCYHQNYHWPFRKNIAKSTTDPRHWLIQHLSKQKLQPTSSEIKLQLGFVWQREGITQSNLDKSM